MCFLPTFSGVGSECGGCNNVRFLKVRGTALQDGCYARNAKQPDRLQDRKRQCGAEKNAYNKSSWAVRMNTFTIL